MQAFLSWLILALFYAYQYIFRVIPSIIMPKMQSDFNMSPDDYGTYNSVYYIGYVLIHIPIGVAIDRFGAKLVVSICILLTAVGSLPLIYCDSFFFVMLGRLVVGIGSAAAAIGAFKVVRSMFDDEKFAMMIGFLVTIGVIGAVFGGLPVNILIEGIGYKNTILSLTYVGIILMILSLIFVPGKSINIKYDDNANLLKEIISIVKNKNFIIIGICGGLMIGPLEGFADAWCVKFFEIVYNFSDKAASSVPSFIFLGLAMGCPIIGYIVGKTAKYYQIIIACGIAMVTIFLIMIFGIGDFTVYLFGIKLEFLYLLLFIVGIASSYQLAIIDKSLTLIPIKSIALASAMINMIIMAFGFLFHKVIGFVINYYCLEDSTINRMNTIQKSSIAMYTSEALEKGMCIIPICLVMGILIAVVLLFVENKKRNK